MLEMLLYSLPRCLDGPGGESYDRVIRYPITYLPTTGLARRGNLVGRAIKH